MCTAVRFADAAGNLYFGRNLDWCESYGEGVVITPRGASIPTQFLGSLSPEHACVGMGIVVGGVPCYFDCANEAGLAIAGLNFPGYAQFAEAPEEGAVNVAAYEFPLWVAASFSTVAEVREALKGVVIVAKAPSEGYGVAQQHWLVGDGKESIVIECQADGHARVRRRAGRADQPAALPVAHRERAQLYAHRDRASRGGYLDARHPARVRQRRGHDRVPRAATTGQPLRAGRLPERALPRRRRRGRQRDAPVPHA